MVSTVSFETTSDQTPGALVFPSFNYVSQVQPDESNITSFLESFVLASRDQPSRQKDHKKTVTDFLKEKFLREGLVTPISTPTILICSHNSRDSRCGILGPLLHQEFSQYINKRRTLRNKVTSELIQDPQDDAESYAISFASHPQFRPNAIDPDHQNQHPINIGMISHIGGHKWAGNVIVYIPPGYQINPLEREHRGTNPKDRAAKEPVIHEDETMTETDKNPFVSPLAGKGIWYGRVQPKHVEGIVEQTIGHGKIIKDLFRGGINQNGTTIRL
jgi:(2Fe-2S) ferredoxin